jgi:hypothetical protein
MRTYDPSPLGGSSVAFDRLLDRVDQDARFEDGLLRINLARMVPEALKPRPIAIAAAGDNDAKVEHKNAA